MLTQINFQGADGWALENGRVRAVVLPGHGGKVASLRYVPNGFEFLFQNPKGVFRSAKTGDPFADFEACGFDDAFPAVDASDVEVDGRVVAYPDHGELWANAFDATSDGDGLQLSFTSPLLGYRYEKRYHLEDSALVCDYHISNPTSHSFPALWVCHCLARMEPDMRLMLPITRVVSTNPGGWLAEKGQTMPYPNAQGPRGPIDLSRMPQSGAMKFYADGPVSEGHCGYHYPQSGMKVWLDYDADKLPYLGFWATSGGFRGDYNCALEPANGFYDSIPCAKAHHACPILQAGQEWRFRLTLRMEQDA